MNFHVAKRQMRVAFIFTGGIGQWTGGFNYLRNVFRVLREYESPRVRPVLFLGPDVKSDEAQILAADLSDPPVIAEWLGASLRRNRLLRSLLFGADVAATRAFAQERIDVVFEAGEFFGYRFPLPALTWVADFQSHHLPQFFPLRARMRTYYGRHLQLRGARLVMLSSRDAEGDCLRFYPHSRGRTVVVPFAIPQPDNLVEDPSIFELHGLPPRYFYLPNQFWKHKNHRVVIEALSIARGAAPDMFVAATGSPIDHRNPEHYDELRSRVVQLGLQDRFKFLGLVPGPHVMQLALQSVAVVNPSKFEGWSTTVEEGKALGIPLLLSEIAVHREQAAGVATFFDPDSPASAADALIAAWKLPSTRPDVRLARAAHDSVERTRAFAKQFGDAISSAAALKA